MIFIDKPKLNVSLSLKYKYLSQVKFKKFGHPSDNFESY